MQRYEVYQKSTSVSEEQTSYFSENKTGTGGSFETLVLTYETACHHIKKQRLPEFILLLISSFIRML